MKSQHLRFHLKSKATFYLTYSMILVIYVLQQFFEGTTLKTQMWANNNSSLPEVFNY